MFGSDNGVLTTMLRGDWIEYKDADTHLSDTVLELVRNAVEPNTEVGKIDRIEINRVALAAWRPRVNEHQQ